MEVTSFSQRKTEIITLEGVFFKHTDNRSS